MEYQIIETGCHSALSKIVNKLIKEGWRPIGGVTVKEWEKLPTFNAQPERCWNYLQAMIKDIKELSDHDSIKYGRCYGCESEYDEKDLPDDLKCEECGEVLSIETEVFKT